MSIISEKIKNFNNSELINGIDLNNHVSFYADLQINKKTHPHYYKFRKRVKQFYRNTYKENLFIDTYLGDALPTVEICENIFSSLSDVFDSQNKSITYNVKGQDQNEIANIMNSYFVFFKTTGFEQYKTDINCFIYVDFDEKNIPFINFIDFQFVKYYKLDINNNVEEIIFSFDNEKYYYFTSEFYSVWNKTATDYIEVQNNPHIFKRCPANVFWKERFNSKSKILAKNIICSQLDELYKYTEKHVELSMSEIHTANPIKMQPSTSCGYESDSYVCKGGRLYYSDNDLNNSGMPLMFDEDTQQVCPSCGYNRHIGAGASYTIDVNNAAESGMDLSKLINYYQPPLEGTEYQKNRLIDYENKIYENTIGLIKRATKEARNEIDVTSDFEKRTKILTRFGEIYSQTIKFCFDIILKYLYKDDYESVNVYLGNKFYLLTKDELLEQKSKADDPVEKFAITKKIFEYEYKYDIQTLKMFSKIYDIVPYAGVSDTDFLELIKLNKVSDFDIELRTNINYYISEFYNKFKNSPSILDTNFIKKEISILVNNKLINQNIKNNEDR